MSFASHNYDSKPYLRDFRLIMFYLIIMTHHGSISSSSPVDVNRFFTGRPCLPVTKKLAHSLARVARAAGDVRQQVGWLTAHCDFTMEQKLTNWVCIQPDVSHFKWLDVNSLLAAAALTAGYFF